MGELKQMFILQIGEFTPKGGDLRCFQTRPPASCMAFNLFSYIQMEQIVENKRYRSQRLLEIANDPCGFSTSLDIKKNMVNFDHLQGLKHPTG